METYPSKSTILNVEFEIKLGIYRSLKMNPIEFVHNTACILSSTTLHNLCVPLKNKTNLFLAHVTTRVSMGSLQNVSQFGPVIWPSIANTQSFIIQIDVCFLLDFTLTAVFIFHQLMSLTVFSVQFFKSYFTKLQILQIF